MSSSPATLDNLNYDELVAEARKALPALAPSWTDYNAHDPGVTLLELFAWLVESDSYRLDQISESAYRAFLRLAGVVPRVAQIAHTVFKIEPTAAVAETVPAGVKVATEDGSVVFATDGPLYVSLAKLDTLLSGAAQRFEDWTLRNTGAAPFPAFGPKPQVGDALYLGFDAPLAAEAAQISLWISTGHEQEDEETATRLRTEREEVLAARAAACKDFVAAQWPAWHVHYGATTVWEFYKGNGKWEPLQDVSDETRALTLGGPVRFTAPAIADHAIGGVALSAYGAKRFIRCRLAQGAYDCPPWIAKIALNAITARHAVAAPQEVFSGNGRAGQKLWLSQKPIVPTDCTLIVKVQGKPDETWRIGASLDGFGPLDRVCVSILNSGAIVFGDGRIGRVPPAGDQNILVNYLRGGGASGNVDDLSLLIDANPRIKVSQLFPAYGGAEAETLNEAKSRAVRELAARTRAITLEDYAALALDVPGAPIARSHAIADYDPGLTCVPVNGSVTVVVLPFCPEQKPEPTRYLLAAVQSHLERRRMLSSELHVVGPRYTVLSVRARLHLLADANGSGVKRNAVEALNRFFHPLRGGPDGKGYPIGRAAYRSELLALLNGIAGVQYATELSWRIDDRRWSQCGNIEVCNHGLLISGTHELKVDEGSGCHE